MNALLLKDWKRKLGPSLSAINGVVDIGFGKFGLAIVLKQEDATARAEVDAVFERECPDVPYVCRVMEAGTKAKV